ncbi:hypothetical protein TNCV_3345281 [Trichonephila clavipes]|nr:hypothetical protein TNCV_3345281 [Trichonephila clavipes]
MDVNNEDEDPVSSNIENGDDKPVSANAEHDDCSVSQIERAEQQSNKNYSPLRDFLSSLIVTPHSGPVSTGDLCIENTRSKKKKEDLRRIASELELCVSDKLTVLDFMDLRKNCERYKNDPDSVHELENLIIGERKYDESQQLELEKIREMSKLDLEIARIRANDKDNNTEISVNFSAFCGENMDESIKTFELSTVTYGTSAPFLATRTLKQLALDETQNFPLGSSVVMSDMYIEDVLTGAETLLEAKELKNQLINIFAK